MEPGGVAPEGGAGGSGLYLQVIGWDGTDADKADEHQTLDLAPADQGNCVPDGNVLALARADGAFVALRFSRSSDTPPTTVCEWAWTPDGPRPLARGDPAVHHGSTTLADDESGSVTVGRYRVGYSRQVTRFATLTTVSYAEDRRSFIAATRETDICSPTLVTPRWVFRRSNRDRGAVVTAVPRRFSEFPRLRRDARSAADSAPLCRAVADGEVVLVYREPCVGAFVLRGQRVRGETSQPHDTGEYEWYWRCDGIGALDPADPAVTKGTGALGSRLGETRIEFEGVSLEWTAAGSGEGRLDSASGDGTTFVCPTGHTELAGLDAFDRGWRFARHRRDGSWAFSWNSAPSRR